VAARDRTRIKKEKKKRSSRRRRRRRRWRKSSCCSLVLLSSFSALFSLLASQDLVILPVALGGGGTGSCWRGFSVFVVVAAAAAPQAAVLDLSCLSGAAWMCFWHSFPTAAHNLVRCRLRVPVGGASEGLSSLAS
jgi:hypothetical protein